MKTIREALNEVANEFDIYSDEAQFEDQRRIVVKFLADFYGQSEDDINDQIKNSKCEKVLVGRKPLSGIVPWLRENETKN